MFGSILWFLILGAFFYFLMMKMGCGMHAHGGHGCHGSHSGHSGHSSHSGHSGHDEDDSQKAPKMVRDPVCGMLIEKRRAVQTFEQDGERYYFCSQNCSDSFREEPARYLHAHAEVHGHY